MLAPVHAANLAAGMTTGKPEFKWMGPLAFGPGGILFIADTKSAATTAVATGDTGPAVSARAPMTGTFVKPFRVGPPVREAMNIAD